MYKHLMHPRLTKYIEILKTHKVYNGNQLLILLAPHIVESIEAKHVTREELANDLQMSLSRLTNLLPVLSELPVITSKIPELIEDSCGTIMVMTHAGVIDLVCDCLEDSEALKELKDV